MSLGGTGTAQGRCRGRTWSCPDHKEPPFLEQVGVSLLVEGRDPDTSVLMTVSVHTGLSHAPFLHFRNSLGQIGPWTTMRKEPGFRLPVGAPCGTLGPPRGLSLGSTTSPSRCSTAANSQRLPRIGWALTTPGPPCVSAQSPSSQPPSHAFLFPSGFLDSLESSFQEVIDEAQHL